jgi:hypothetical protein
MESQRQETSSILAAVFRYLQIIITFIKTRKINESLPFLVRKRTIPTGGPTLVGEISANFRGQRGDAWSAQRVRTIVNLGFVNWISYFSFK